MKLDPVRWQRLNELFEQAEELDATARAAFLAQACADDEALRREVEALFAADAQAERTADFLSEPALETIAKTMAAQSFTGQTISHYRIHELLGRGGMGEVYRAEDQRLGRVMALKLLPPEFTQDDERLQRFKQEARAASSLNHPNIITIFEIGETDGLHFIATEFIDGVTLRQRLSEALLPLTESLDIAAQLASALAAAHDAGIIHRDIKPENVMIRRDGIVKVLDFGLAKLTEKQNPQSAIRIRTSLLIPARYSARRATCRPNKFAASKWTRAPTSSVSASCCMKCSPDVRRSRAFRLPKRLPPFSNAKLRRSLASVLNCNNLCNAHSPKIATLAGRAAATC
jgi:serine/threonine protein kinase